MKNNKARGYKAGHNHPYLSDITRMHKYALSLPYEVFYEPVSVIDRVGKKRKLINFTPDMVKAWVKHSCYSSRVRMLNLEEAALSELSQSRLLPSMVLIRSHMEAAGMACLCHAELLKWLKTNDSSSLQELIPATFLGTSLIRAKKKDETLEEMLFLSEQDKVSTSRLISALDEFLSSNDPAGHTHTLYGLLCEYTHPNMRAIRDYIKIKDHKEEGWFHHYHTQARVSKQQSLLTLQVLMCSMKAGHAACEMLLRTQFQTDGRVTNPTEAELKTIWKNFVKWPEKLK